MSPLFGPDPQKVLDRGAPVPGRIVGIRVRWTHDDDPVRLDEYAVEAGGPVHGVRQRLEPVEDVRLGLPVNLRVDKGAAVIDWGEVGTFRWKALKEPPATGIEDDSDDLGKARRKWTSGTATVERVESRSKLMGLARSLDATVVVRRPGEEPYEITVGGLEPAFYASHLLVAGAILPVWVDPKRPDKLKVDWAQAAMDDPGVGRPAATFGADEPARSVMGTGGDTAVASAEPAAPPVAPGGFAARMLARAGVSVDGDPYAVDDPVGWDAFIAVERGIAAAGWEVAPEQQEQLARAQGVAPGAWPAARERWQERVGRDLAIGQSYRRALGG